MTDYAAVDILLVEDSVTDAELTLRALRKHNLANQVHWAKDGQEALDFIFGNGEHAGRKAGKGVRLVLLDLKMPRVDGIEVLRRLKADERTRAIPVVIMTSSDQDRDVVASYNLGVNSYVVKPVEFGQFTKTVAEVGLYWIVTNRGPE